MKKSYSALVLFLGLSTFLQAQQSFTNNQSASLVIGQTSFTSQSTAASQTITENATAVAVSVHGAVAVGSVDGRVLIWNSIPVSDGTPADVIVGKPDFTATITGCSQSLCSAIRDVAFSPDGNKLFVADAGNNRVLIWNSIPTTNGQNADVVIGQANFVSSTFGTSANQFYQPTGVTATPDGRLVICDELNNRVLIFNSIPATNGASANYVVGQPDFVSSSSGSGLNQFTNPFHSSVAPDGRFLVSDANSNRIAVYDSVPSINGGSMDNYVGTGVSGVSATQLSAPLGMTHLPDGRLVVADNSNNRVIAFNPFTGNSPSASLVFGQANFASSVSSGPNAQSLTSPYSVAADLNGRLYVAGAHRVLVFGSVPTQTADLSLSIAVSANTLCLNNLFSYSVAITNNGASTASNVIVSADFPFQQQFVSASSIIGTYSALPGQWVIPSLTAGTSAMLVLTGNVISSPYTALTLYAGIAGSSAFDDQMSNNGVTHTMTVLSAAAPVISAIQGPTAACAGISSTFSLSGISGATNYLWQAVGNATVNSTSTIAIAAFGTFNSTLSAIASNTTNGCKSNPVSQSVAINALPVVSVSGPTAICVGGSASYTASGATTYSWSTGATSSLLAVSPASLTTYTVTGTDGNGCMNSSSAVLQVNALPLVSVSAPTAVCSGVSALLTASGASSYSWNTSATGSVLTVTPSSLTSYTVIGTDAHGCVNATTLALAVNPLPTVAVSGPTAVCMGNTASLVAIGAASYSWNTGATNSVLAVSPSALTSYTVTGTDANGCLTTASAVLAVDPALTVSIAGTGSLCLGSSASYTVSGANTYSWSNAATSSVITVTPASSTIYTVTGMNGSTCSNTSAISVTVNSLPPVSITGPTTTCLGSNVILTANGASSYSWSTASTASMITVSPAASSAYTVTGMATNGCTKSATVSLAVNPLPAVSVSGPAVSCAGSTVSFTASGGTTYLWDNTATTSVITESPSTSSTYTVTGTDANGCANSATAALLVNALPQVAIAGSTVVCIGSSASFSASGAGNYLWSTGATSPTISVLTTSTSSYSVTGTDANGCSASATVPLFVDALPPVSVSGPTAVCLGSVASLTASGANTYSWSTAATTSVINISPSAAVVYTVTGVNINSCAQSATISLLVNNLPTVSILGSTLVCSGSSVSLTGSGAATYVWSDNATASVIAVSPPASTVYSVTGTDVNGCVQTATLELTVVPLPVISVSTSNTIICSGESTELSAYGAVTYSWSGIAATYSVLVAPPVTSEFTVTGADASGCSTQTTITQTVASCDGISVTAARSKLKIYPNPNNGTFSIDGVNNATNLEIINNLGQTVQSITISSGSQNVSLPELPPGIYYIVSRNEQAIKEKLIITQ